MKYMFTILLLSVISISCQNNNKSPEFSKQTDDKITYENNVLAAPGSGCMSEDEEAKSDFSVAGMPGLRTPGLSEGQTDLPSIHVFPSESDVRKAIEGAFRTLPTKAKWFKSLVAAKPLRIYSKPDSKSLEIGMIDPQVPIPPVGYIKGKGCKSGWIQVGISAFVCSKNLHKDRREPEVQIFPVVKENDITPGKYAYVRLGGTKWYASRNAVKQGKHAGEMGAGFYVHFKRFTRINGKNYWKTVKNQYVPVENIAAHRPSTHMGVSLDGNMTLPLVFPIAKDSSGKGIAIPVYDRPGGAKVAKTNYHQAVKIYGEKKVAGRKYYRLGRCRWIMARHVAAAFPSPVPPGVRSDEKWLDINLLRQTIVAWEGSRPVFASIISSGKGGHPTKHGVFRVYWKVSETDMKNEVGADEQYLAADVPWTLFFYKGQALHGAYWHDDFGRKKSHGCINLAPKDARFIYEWSTPYAGSSWAYQWSGQNSPGMTVQIRRNDEDRPMVFGYARNFIPEKQLLALDEAYKKKIEAETKQMLAENDDDDKGDSPLSKNAKKNAESTKKQEVTDEDNKTPRRKVAKKKAGRIKTKKATASKRKSTSFKKIRRNSKARLK
ncbi:L,D-transpeptidase family protein [Myxococcota bacterium]|nr:L,D-transpeptidase family protein [Myxococcota bacterium]MBU1380879.1 L,D-transpeptidase family protein [Myxococcota bacterium]MBU1497007.1 L,D-transpeptidase family protein [Myxococcota bacterium]